MLGVVCVFVIKSLMFLMMGVCTRNMSSYEYTNKITLLHLVGISSYFMKISHHRNRQIMNSLRKVSEAVRISVCHDRT